MLKILQREDWVAEIEKVRPLKMNEELSVVSFLCQEYALVPAYFLYHIKNNLVISYVALTKRKKIIHPSHFFYSSFWIKETLSENQYCEYLDGFLNALLKLYQRVEIKLPVGIDDMRPFLWQHFSVNNYYTYLKKLDSLDYHTVTEKNIRKAREIGYECRWEPLTATSLELNLQIFKDFKVYSSSSIRKIERLMLAMQRNRYLASFNCYNNDELVASNLIFLDKNNKIAYTVLLNKTSRSNKDDVHSLLHDFFFTKLNEDGYECVDLLGGDMRGIAPFKSRFNTVLKPHFVVKFERKNAAVKKGIATLKYVVKKFLAKIN